MRNSIVFVLFLLISKSTSGLYLSSKSSIQHHFALKSPTTSSITHLADIKSMVLAIPLGVMSFIFLTTGSRNLAEESPKQNILRNLFFLSAGFVGFSGAEQASTNLDENCSIISGLWSGDQFVTIKHPSRAVLELESPSLYIIHSEQKGYTVISTDRDNSTWICTCR